MGEWPTWKLTFNSMVKGVDIPLMLALIGSKWWVYFFEMLNIGTYHGKGEYSL